MKSFATKLPVYLLLLTGCIPMITAMFFLTKEQVLRHEMREKLEQQLLHTLVLSSDDVRWIEQDKEIWVNGKLFDVKCWKEEKGKYIFSGLYDDEETTIWLMQKQAPGQSPDRDSRLLVKLFQWWHTVYQDQDKEDPAGNAFASLLTGTVETGTASPYHAILTPPPRA